MRDGMGRARVPVSAAMVALLAVTAVGCSGEKVSADKCQAVSGELIDVPTRTDQEPKMRVPVPAGWERTTKMDSENIRFALRNQSLSADGFTPNAVVTLQKVSADIGKPEQLLEAQNDQLSKKLKVADMNSTPAQVCGATALATTYTAPEMKINPKIPPIPPRTATSLGVVYKTGDVSYVATITVQTVKPDNPTYIKDADTIIKGFQLLPAS